MASPPPARLLRAWTLRRLNVPPVAWAALLALGAVRCTGDPSLREAAGEGEGDDADGTRRSLQSALTSPTGANWIVLPRPPARTSSLFTDAYAAPFVATGTNFTATPDSTTKTEGTTSLNVTLQTANAEFGAAITALEAPYSAASQTEVTFAFNAGAAVGTGIATLAVAVDDDNPATPLTWVPLQPYLASGAIAANTWYRVLIPQAALNPSNLPLRKVLFGNRSLLTNVSFFIDDLRMSWTDPSPTETSVYADANAANWTVGGWSVTNASNVFRTTGSSANRSTFTAAWGAATYVYNWNLPAFPAGAHTTVSFDISGGSGAPPAGMNNLYVGLDTAPTKKLVTYVPGGFKANTWHRVTLRTADLLTGPYRYLTLKNESTALYSFFVDDVRFQVDHAPPPLRDATPPPNGDPDGFGASEVDVVTNVKTGEERKPISSLIYGINGFPSSGFPADLLSAVTLVRRGGDRGNSYNWETNVSNGSLNNNFVNDMNLAGGTPDASAPAATDLALLAQHRPAGRAVMVPFVLQDWVSGPQGTIGGWDQPGWNRGQYFRRVGFVKPTPFSAVPDLGDGMVYTDEHLQYMRDKYPGVDITAPGPGQLLVGIDNEPDLYHYNFPMLQSGTGAAIVSNGQTIGNRVTTGDFTARAIAFARKVKQIAPQSTIVGPSHYHFDGWTNWHGEDTSTYSNSPNGRWYMDDFLASVKTASEQEGKRLLDTWDFHWYPQGMSGGKYVWDLDNASRALTAAEVQQIVQGPRSYWDPTYNENSWITEPWHLGEPTKMLPRLKARIDAAYPGTKLGVTEYNPGGRNHISSGLGVVDSLGVFQRLGVNIAAFWPVGNSAATAYAYGGLKLLRNADGNGLAYAETDVRVEHPEVAESSVYAGSDTAKRVTVLIVNKTTATRTFGVRAYNAERLTTVDVYRIDAAHSSPYLVTQDQVTKVNAYAYSAPSLSATMLVFRAP